MNIKDLSEWFQYDTLAQNDNYIWILSSRYATVLEIDLDTFEVRVLFSIKEYIGHVRDFRAMCFFDEKLFLFPSYSREICIYDFKNCSYTIKPMPDGLLDDKDDNWSAELVLYKNYAFMCWANPLVVRYDMKKDKWEISRLNIDLFDRDNSKKFAVTRGSFIKDGRVWFGILDTNKLVSVNIESMEYEIVELLLSNKDAVIDVMNYDDGDLWIISSLDNDKYIEHIDSNLNFVEKQFVCKGDMLRLTPVLSGKSKVWMFPGTDDTGYIFDKVAKRIEKISGIPTVNKGTLTNDWLSSMNYYNGINYNGKYLIIHSWSQIIIQIDLNADNMETRKMQISYATLKRIREIKNECDKKEWVNSHIFIAEGIDNDITLSKWIENIPLHG